MSRLKPSKHVFCSSKKARSALETFAAFNALASRISPKSSCVGYCRILRSNLTMITSAESRISRCQVRSENFSKTVVEEHESCLSSKAKFHTKVTSLSASARMKTKSACANSDRNIAIHLRHFSSNLGTEHKD